MWPDFVPSTWSDYVLTFLPYIAAIIAAILVIKALSLEPRKYAVYFSLSSAFSLLLLSPVLAIPFFGIIGAGYLYLPVVDREQTFYWGRVFFPREPKQVEHILRLLVISILGFTASGIAFARLLGLHVKGALKSFSLFVSLTLFITVSVAWGVLQL